MTQMPADAPLSEDGQWWWDGSAWQPVTPGAAAAPGQEAAAGQETASAEPSGPGGPLEHQWGQSVLNEVDVPEMQDDAGGEAQA